MLGTQWPTGKRAIAQAGLNVLCSWVRHFTLTVSLHPGVLMGTGEPTEETPYEMFGGTCGITKYLKYTKVAYTQLLM